MKQKFFPKVSIIIPVYNGSNYLREAIDSALNQTYKNIEILVINDGSSDRGETEDICKSYGDKIRYFNKVNGGAASALNMGVAKMEGEYFSWLSHDDIYYPEKVEVQIDYLSEQENRDVILYCNYELINEKSQHTSFVEFNHEMLVEKPEYSLLRGCVNGITLLIPKKAFKKHGNFNESLKCTQDYDLWRRFSETFQFVHLPIIITKTRIHAEQDSNKHPNVITEGDELWISMMENTPNERKRELEGSLYSFYRGMSLHLAKSPYKGALEVADMKMEEISEKAKNEIDKIKVSVIIPFYNRIQSLLETLDSVVNQTHINLEILLINDASTADKGPIEKYIKKDDRIKLITLTKNRGPATARNVGIKKATGEYIAFLDSDDLFSIDKIQKQLLLMYLTKWNVSHTSYIRRANGKDELIEIGLLDGKVIPEIIASCQIATPTVMINSRYLKDNNFAFREDFRIGEDTCFWLEVLRKTNLLGIPMALTVVNVNANSAANNFEKQIVGLTNILKVVLADTEYSRYHREISNLCYRYFQISGEMEANEKTSLYKDYSFWSKKPENFLLKMVFLLRHQGIRTTLRKLKEKYL